MSLFRVYKAQRRELLNKVIPYKSFGQHFNHPRLSAVISIVGVFIGLYAVKALEGYKRVKRIKSWFLLITLVTLLIPIPLQSHSFRNSKLLTSTPDTVADEREFIFTWTSKEEMTPQEVVNDRR